MPTSLRQGRVRSTTLCSLLLVACATARTPTEPRPRPKAEAPDLEVRHPCDPIASREPFATDGGVCGDGVRGQRCELHRVNACGEFSEFVSCEAPELCEASDLQSSLFYDWQEQLFDNAATARQPPVAAAPSKALEARVEALEKQVARKDAVIAWVTEEHVKLKKALWEP